MIELLHNRGRALTEIPKISLIFVSGCLVFGENPGFKREMREIALTFPPVDAGFLHPGGGHIHAEDQEVVRFLSVRPINLKRGEAAGGV